MLTIIIAAPGQQHTTNIHIDKQYNIHTFNYKVYQNNKSLNSTQLNASMNM